VPTLLPALRRCALHPGRGSAACALFVSVLIFFRFARDTPAVAVFPRTPVKTRSERSGWVLAWGSSRVRARRVGGGTAPFRPLRATGRGFSPCAAPCPLSSQPTWAPSPVSGRPLARTPRASSAAARAPAAPAVVRGKWLHDSASTLVFRVVSDARAFAEIPAASGSARAKGQMPARRTLAPSELRAATA
jgi:hypothetical protein